MSEAIAKVAVDSTHLAVPSRKRTKRFTQSVSAGVRKTDGEVDRNRDNDFFNIENIHHYITKAFNQELDHHRSEKKKPRAPSPMAERPPQPEPGTDQIVLTIERASSGSFGS